jgi:hypothetical protein
MQKKGCAKCWSSIKRDLNMSDLKEILPVYTPPDAVWEGIAEELSPLRGLQTTPPDTVWQHIEAELANNEKNHHRVGLLGRFPGWYAAAAGLLLPLVAAALYALWQQPPTETISYSEEKNTIQKVAYNSDFDQQYARIQALCSKQITVCEKPDFKNLKRELDDLTTASLQLKEAIGAYNTDADLAQQLADIERERGVILRKLEQRI